MRVVRINDRRQTIAAFYWSEKLVVGDCLFLIVELGDKTWRRVLGKKRNVRICLVSGMTY